MVCYWELFVVLGHEAQERSWIGGWGGSSIGKGSWLLVGWAAEGVSGLGFRGTVWRGAFDAIVECS